MTKIENRIVVVSSILEWLSTLYDTKERKLDVLVNIKAVCFNLMTYVKAYIIQDLETNCRILASTGNSVSVV